MTWLSKVSIGHRKLLMLITVLVVGLAAYAIPQLKQQLLPNLSFPSVTVTASYSGASPEAVEEQVVEPIEDALQTVDGVESITATSSQGSASVLIEFDYSADTEEKQNEVESALAGAELPDEATAEVASGSTDDQASMVLAVTSDTDQSVLADRLSDSVVPELEAVDGVNQVTVTGERDKQISVVLDEDALADHGLTTDSVSSALSELGSSEPAGSIEQDGETLSIQVGDGDVDTVKELEDVWISASSDGSATASTEMPSAAASGTSSDPAKLGDVAEVATDQADATSLTRTNGEESLGVSLTLDHDGSAASVSDDVRAQLADLEEELGDGAEITVVSDTGPQVQESIDSLWVEGLLGLLMAVLVIVLFLRSARSTLVTAVSIPLSILVALIALWVGGYSLNTLTLGGLTVAVGRVVDDSIVVLENIKRHLGYGQARRGAVLDGVREVASAVTSSTLTTVCVFIPIALVSGIVGELFAPFAVSVVAAMLASLVISLTLVPALAYWFMKPPAPSADDAEAFRARVEEKERRGLLQRTYVPVIDWAVRHRKTVVSGAVALLVATLMLTTGLKTSFLGDTGSDSVSVTQTLDEGASLSTTDKAARTVENALTDIEGIDSYQVTVGGGGEMSFFGGSSSSNTAEYSIALEDGADSDAVEDDLRDTFDELTGVGELTIGSDSSFGTSSAIDVTVQSDDEDALRDAVGQIEDALSDLDEVTDVTSDLSQVAPQISIELKGEEAAAAGVTTSQVASAVGAAVQGTTATQVTVDGEDRDVVVYSTSDSPETIADLKSVELSTSSGGTVAVGDVATVTKTEEPVERERIDGTGSATVSATPKGEDTGSASQAVRLALDDLDLPSGVSYETGGVSADQSEAFGQLGLAIAAAIALVFLLLVAAFRSIRQTLVLLVSVPFAATGAIVALLITGQPLGVAALIGVLMLVGIVVTNAIVLVDLINQYRQEGMGIDEAVREGGRRRLRPILMTAMATVCALLPMALGLTGSGGFISQPLAVVVIGGLFSSTVLTLVLIPTLYTGVEKRRERKAAKRDARRRRGRADGPRSPAPPRKAAMR